MLYLWLSLAILFEAGWAIAMKMSHGFTRLGPTAATIVMYLLSVVFLARATKDRDVGVYYAIWAGAGMALIAAAGMTYFKEPVTTAKIVFIGVIIVGIAGLKITAGGH